MTKCEVDHSNLSIHSPNGQHIYLVVQDDDIDGVQQLKCHFKHFQTKDLGPLKYVLTVEVSQSTTSIAINQQKYDLEILIKTGMLDSCLMDARMDLNVKPLWVRGANKRPVKILNPARPNITFPAQ